MTTIQFDICNTGFYASMFWATILRKERSEATRNSVKFEDWMLDQYKCKLLTNYHGGYTGVEIEDDGLTMLLLKYSTSAVLM